MNTKIKTWVGAVVIIIIVITIGAFVWVYEKNQPEIAPAQVDIVKNIDTAINWKTYTNSKYKFEFKYPNNWIDQGRFLEDINFFKNGEKDTLGVLQIELETKHDNGNSLTSIAEQLINENNCKSEGAKSPDHIIKETKSGVILSLFCTAGSEVYEYLFKHSNNDVIKLGLIVN